MTSMPRRCASITTSLPSSPEPSSNRRVAPGVNGVPIFNGAPVGGMEMPPYAIVGRQSLADSAAGGANEEGEPDGLHVVAQLLVRELHARQAAAPAIAHAQPQAGAAAVLLVERVVVGEQVAVAVLAGHVEAAGALQRQADAEGLHGEVVAGVVECAVLAGRAGARVGAERAAPRGGSRRAELRVAVLARDDGLAQVD